LECRKLGGKRPLKPEEIWAIRFMLDQNKRVRNRVMQLRVDAG
jgi:hypothetical protein